MADTVLAPNKSDSDSNYDDLFHYYCCNENRSLCGRDLSNHVEMELEDSDQTLCVVCAELDGQTCQECGR